jgi:hypothetical protein
MRVQNDALVRQIVSQLGLSTKDWPKVSTKVPSSGVMSGTPKLPVLARQNLDSRKIGLRIRNVVYPEKFGISNVNEKWLAPAVSNCRLTGD